VNQLEESMEACNKAISIDKALIPDVYYVKGLINFKKQSYKEACENFDMCLSLTNRMRNFSEETVRNILFECQNRLIKE
jgi:tetratricopeptide (TPR) repeat protein